MDLFRLEPGLFLWTLICFGIVVVVLQRWALPPLLNNLAARQAQIAGNLAEAQRLTEALAALETERNRVLEAAGAEAQALLTATRQDAAALRVTLVAAAQAEAAEVLAQAGQKALAERRRVVLALQDDLAALVCDTAEGLVGRAFLAQSDRDWSLAQVARL